MRGNCLSEIFSRLLERTVLGENADIASRSTERTTGNVPSAEDNQEKSKVRKMSNDEVKNHKGFKRSVYVRIDYVNNRQPTWNDIPTAADLTDTEHESDVDIDTDNSNHATVLLVENKSVINDPSEELSMRERTDSETSEESGIVEEFMSSFESSYQEDMSCSSSGDNNMIAEAPLNETDPEICVTNNYELNPTDTSHKAEYLSDRKPESTKVSSLQNSGSTNEKRRQAKSLRKPRNAPPCSTCKLIKKGRPFPVLRGRLLEYVSRECTQPFEDTDEIKQMDYICLSGIHLLNVKGAWELADGTEISETENVSDICFGDSIAVHITKYYLGKFICKLYPSKERNGKGKWQVLLNPETSSKRRNFLDDGSIESAESEIDNASHPIIDCSNEQEENKNQTSQQDYNLNNNEDDQQFIPNKMIAKVDIQTEKIPGDLVNVIKQLPKRMSDVLISSSYAPPRARYNMPQPTDQFMSDGVRKRSQELLDQMTTVINQVQEHFAAASTPDGFELLGDDYKAPPIGHIVRVKFCSVLAEILKIGFRETAMPLQFLLGRRISMNLWTLVKEVGNSMDCKQIEVVLRFVQTCEYAQSDDDRYRLVIAEFLSQDNQEQHEKLLISWFRKFLESDKIIQDYYMPGTLWRCQGLLTNSLLIENIWAQLELVCHFPYSLHPDFEWSYMRKMPDRDQKDGFNFDRKVDVQGQEVFCFE